MEARGRGGAGGVRDKRTRHVCFGCSWIEKARTFQPSSPFLPRQVVLISCRRFVTAALLRSGPIRSNNDGSRRAKVKRRRDRSRGKCVSPLLVEGSGADGRAMLLGLPNQRRHPHPLILVQLREQRLVGLGIGLLQHYTKITLERQHEFNHANQNLQGHPENGCTR